VQLPLAIVYPNRCAILTQGRLFGHCRTSAFANQSIAAMDRAVLKSIPLPYSFSLVKLLFFPSGKDQKTGRFSFNFPQFFLEFYGQM